MVDTYKGDFSMMFRKWMIGACVAVAAMVGGAAAEAQTETEGLYGHRAHSIKIINHGAVPMTAQVDVPEDEAALEASYRRAGDGVKEVIQTTVAPYSSGALYHSAVAPTPKTGTRQHILKIRNAKTGKVVFTQVLSMSKLQKLATTSQAGEVGYQVDIRRNGKVQVTPVAYPAVAP
ncbi:MAG: hypothetical protein WCI38_11235 [Chthoniobacterales bacterium]